jgi:hypothetical protein
MNLSRMKRCTPPNVNFPNYANAIVPAKEIVDAISSL